MKKRQSDVEAVEQNEISVDDHQLESSEALRGKLADIAAKRDDTAKQLAEAERFENENILETTNDVLEDNDSRILRLRRQATRLEKIETILKKQLAKALDVEAEKGRVDRYEIGKRLAAESDEWIREVYPKHAAAIANGLARMSEIQIYIKLVNKDLPEGAKFLDAEEAQKPPPPTLEDRYDTFYVDRNDRRIWAEVESIVERHGRYFLRSEEVFKRRTPRMIGPPEPTPVSLCRSVNLPRGAYKTKDFWPLL